MASYCSRCGKELDRDAAYCKHCGAEVTGTGEGQIPKAKPKRVTVVTIVSYFLGAFLLALAIYFIVAKNKPVPPPAPQEQVLVNEVVSVPAHNSTYYQFTLNRNAVLTGNFRAFGGSGNDIVVLVMDADSYVNWTNGHDVNVAYNSGQVTVGRLSVGLSPGRYCLVFDNRFSVVTNKSVEAHVSLIAR